MDREAASEPPNGPKAVPLALRTLIAHIRWAAMVSALLVTGCSAVAPAVTSTPDVSVSNASTAPQSAVPSANPVPTAVPPSATPLATSEACVPTDQDRYVFEPSRLKVAAACIRVTGTVTALRPQADGDIHILLALDPTFKYLLRPGNTNSDNYGALVVEPICVGTVVALDAKESCAADPDPFSQPFPRVGQHIWMEGRYVFDLNHLGWAELHPLYRWGPV